MLDLLPAAGGVGLQVRTQVTNSEEPRLNVLLLHCVPEHVQNEFWLCGCVLNDRCQRRLRQRGDHLLGETGHFEQIVQKRFDERIECGAHVNCELGVE
jgi:hypothetical protein